MGLFRPWHFPVQFHKSWTTELEIDRARVAISDRKNRIGVGKFSDRPEFGRQSRQILSAKSGNRQNRQIGKIGVLLKIGRSAKSGYRKNWQIGKIGGSLKIGRSAKSGDRKNRQIGNIGGSVKIGRSVKSADWGKSAYRRNRRVGGNRRRIGDRSAWPRFFCRIGNRSARPKFFSEIATLITEAPQFYWPTDETL